MTEKELWSVLADALEHGIEPERINHMVTTLAKPSAPGAPVPEAQSTVYDELPDGLIEIADAASKFGCSPSQLRSWVKRGHIPARGRLKYPAPGGGRLIVSEDDVIARINAPPNKGGRPKKTCPNY